MKIISCNKRSFQQSKNRQWGSERHLRQACGLDDEDQHTEASHRHISAHILTYSMEVNTHIYHYGT